MERVQAGEDFGEKHPKEVNAELYRHADKALNINKYIAKK